jgi:hypothetical protein
VDAAELPKTNVNDRSSHPRGPDRHSRAAVILGNDALVAARPSTPAQLSHACHAAGFDIVVPPTWGDELVASAYLARLADCPERVAVACTCPRVRALIDCTTPTEGVCSASVAAPPVAAARYLRATHGASLLITYVGDCPAASDREINARFSPHGFFASLERQGISIASQPVSVSEAERARWQRHHSLPGGLPALRWLARPPVDRVLREARDAKIDAARWASTSRASVLLDFADASSCACGSNRALIEEGERERSMVPVVVAPVDLDLTPSSRLVVPESHQAPLRAPTPPRGAAVPVASPPPARAATATPRAAPTSAAAEPARGRTVLALVPIVVLAIAAALGGAAYAVTSATPTSRAAADSSTSGGAIAETTPSIDSLPGQDSVPPAASTDTIHDSTTVLPAVRPQETNRARADSATADSAKADTAAAGPDTLSAADSARRARRARRVEVVPGWLPQSGVPWTPGDTGRLRRPPTPTPPPAKPDTIPRA